MDEWFEIAIKGIIMTVMLLVFAGGLGLLLAWPLKWTWNYVIPYLFGLKEITWGQAWCLMWVASTLVKSTLTNK